MNSTHKLISLTPVAAAVTAALCPGQSAEAQEAASRTDFLEEITVTARKRTESAQEIPSAIQAISQDSLASMGAKGMEDYARFVPSINVVSYGAGSSVVVFRGAITGPSFIGQATSSVYLDEISVTQTGSQPNIRTVDIARVEALSGPQGTLYGSDAQAGTLRIVTNQPVLNEFEAMFDSELRGGSQSDVSYRSSLMFNVPLVDDTLAMRVVGYKDHDGGYIDNVFGRTADSYGFGENKAPSGWGTLDNSASVKDRWNDADVVGGRIHLLWNMNDRWSTTLSYHHQSTDSGSENYYDPYVGDLQTVRFHDEWRKEDFNMASIKIDGDLGFAQLVAAVSYYERTAESQFDNTNYAHYWAAQYCHDSSYTPNAAMPYYWTNPETGYLVLFPVYCQGPTVESDYLTKSAGKSDDDKLTAEIRLSSEGENFDWIVGLYREESGNGALEGTPFAVPTTGGDGSNEIYQNSVSLQYWEMYWSNYYGTPTTYPNAQAHWYSGGHTDWEQTAVFGETTWHINDEWDLTLGGRYFDRSNVRQTWVDHPGGPGWSSGEPDTTSGDRDYRVANNGAPPKVSGGETQFIPKISLNYNFADNKMVYALYTRGLRQGGVNNIRGEPFFPRAYESDIMDNYEVGFKSTFGEGRGRFNMTAYNMIWDKYQLSLVDPTDPPCEVNGVIDYELSIAGVCGQPYQNLIANAGNAHIDGVNVELDYALGENWTLGMNYEWMEAETDTDQDLTGDGEPDLVAGLRLPLVPSSKAAWWVGYSKPTQLFGGTEFSARTQWSYTGDSLTILDPRGLDDPNPQFKSPSYVIGDLRFSLDAEDWGVSLFINNLTDERAVYTTGTGTFEWGAAQTAEGRAHHSSLFVARPREAGLRFWKGWGE
ncbi:MAG: TonB-dependent receptor [Woeseia sp.]